MEQFSGIAASFLRGEFLAEYPHFTEHVRQHIEPDPGHDDVNAYELGLDLSSTASSGSATRPDAARSFPATPESGRSLLNVVLGETSMAGYRPDHLWVARLPRRSRRIGPHAA